MTKYTASAVSSSFLSTLPARGATAIRPAPTLPSSFLSTLPARGATAAAERAGENSFNFYPRSPRGERLFQQHTGAGEIIQFLSTLPARGATDKTDTYDPADKFLSTLPARGATAFLLQALDCFPFLSTLPARGATLLPLWFGGAMKYFYPRSPRGERHRLALPAPGRLCISIHAPREGSDINALQALGTALHFYPRSPRGERRRAAFR